MANPTTVEGRKAFLGFGNFYHRFVHNFSEITQPLYNLTRKDTVWNWNKSCQKTFDQLKQTFSSAPVLIMPNTTKSFQLETDALNYATGAVLSQQDAEDKWHPCAYLSQSMSPAEHNYDIYDKELLAIMRALEEWRHYLEGAADIFEIHTDHKNLAYFREAHKLNRRQAQWALYLSRFHFHLLHQPKRDMTIPNAFSRRADHDLGGSDNTDQVLLPDTSDKQTTWTKKSTRH